jgi:hypothetical protein
MDGLNSSSGKNNEKTQESIRQVAGGGTVKRIIRLHEGDEVPEGARYLSTQREPNGLTTKVHVDRSFFYDYYKTYYHESTYHYYEVDSE